MADLLHKVTSVREDGAVLLARIGALASAGAPSGWERVEVRFRQVGHYTELERIVVMGDTTLTLDGSSDLSDTLTELRAQMYEPGRGSWLQAHCRVRPQGDFDFDVDAEPRWRRPPPDLATELEAERKAFPREEEHLPDWWRRATGLPLAVTFRHARVAAPSGGATPRPQTPLQHEPKVPESEVPLLLRYLERQPEVLVSSGLGPDAFSGGADVDVPQSYHTDGTWVWPAAVPHYLRKYGLPPEPDFLAHIRRRGFQPPYVDKLTRRTAAADLLGRPRPKADPRDFTPTSGEIAAALETEPDPRLEDAAVLVVLAQRLGEQGVWAGAYRIAARADGMWCLNTTEQGWEVARYCGGEPVNPRYFERAEDAAQHLLGALLLHPGRMTGGRETPLETAPELADWPIQPADGEPPLTLLRNKRTVRLTVGTVVLRFGDETGNLVHHDETRFPATSLPIERERREWRYRLRRPLTVLLGVAVPWAGLPGGAVGYVLPKVIRDHLADGSLEKL
ncbi:MAG TPA: TNT domain-containing protein [Amycolatopsis sp.]|uniref:TNT domain-containing protein n=1 Tax=Amycolatopsis sp. TaxID=37632 RepID=UPI002B46FCBA|nr:TNT domain-containing protein [Amycolatopsis sp.]HKS48811.1 TNT domain-containing protein [Amycolatopsis sp.]